MTKAREFLTIGVVATMFAAGITAATPASAGDYRGGGWRGFPGGGFDGYDYEVARMGEAIGDQSLDAIAAGVDRSRYLLPKAAHLHRDALGSVGSFVQAPVRC